MTEPASVLLQSTLPLPLKARGKVRDIYEAGEHLLIVTTDRISAYDCVLPNGIPRKGEVLNQISLFWFELLRDLIPNHLIASEVELYPEPLRLYADQLRGRSTLVRRADMIPVECVARGYLAGSGWKEYRDTGAICGVKLPPGLRESERLPAPLFTPATKAETGHDENVSIEAVAQTLGIDLAFKLRDLTIAIYQRAAEYAETRGIIVADTKFEFGFVDGQLILADEVLTPDSSRFWPRQGYEAGGPQPSFDKQFVRDYLEALPWNKQPPAPVLTEDVVLRTSEKYLEAYRILTGRSL